MMSNYPYKASSSSSNGGDGLGLGLLGETLPDTIKIEHVFTLQFSDKLERPLRKWVDKVLDLSKHYAESFHFIAVGIASYFFFLGVSKIVQASSSNSSSSSRHSRDDDCSCNTKKNKSKNKDKDKSKESTHNIRSGSSSQSRKTKTKDASTTQQQPASIPLLIDDASKTTTSPDSEPRDATIY